MQSIKIHDEERGEPISEKLFGIFLEDINFACDGGLSANLLNNGGFDGVYLTKESCISAPKPGEEFPNPPKQFERIEDPLRFWSTKGSIHPSREHAMNNVGWHVLMNDGAVLINYGYAGQAESDGIYVRSGHQYRLTCFICCENGTSRLSARICDRNGVSLSSCAWIEPGGEWKKYETFLNACEEGFGQLELCLEGGSIRLDALVLVDTNCWGYNDPRWTGGLMRRDLVETLQELKPSFMRFPGGSMILGVCPGNEYKWKNTIGSPETRIPDSNHWNVVYPSGYSQSYFIGFYEYFLLCEDLGAEPVPVLWAGLNAQHGAEEKGPSVDSTEFYDNVISPVLDLIEYANGNPDTNYWAGLRCKSGHPQPFGLKRIAIGNENYGPYYLAAFDSVYHAVNERYPDITLILSTCPDAMNTEEQERTVSAAKRNWPDCIIDEHFYNPSEWLFENTGIYDTRERKSNRIMLGEYAAKSMTGPDADAPNNWRSALSEAAFLTGLERNSDILRMSCYAPLLALVGGTQWEHNLIYFNQRAVMRTANYYVQRLWSEYTGTESLAVDGDAKGALYYSASKDADSVYIKIVSADAEDCDITLELDSDSNEIARVIRLGGEPMQRNLLTENGVPDEVIFPRNGTLAFRDGKACIRVSKYSVNIIICRY